MTPTPLENEKIADRYEALCRQRQWQPLQPWLDQLPLAQQPDLAAVLIGIEWDYRRQFDEPCDWPERLIGLDPSIVSQLQIELQRLALESSSNDSSPSDQSPSGPCPQPIVSQTWRTGDRLGPYQLLSPLGMGGMGEVWMAEQAMPVKRYVAIKLIKSGLQSREILLRFEAERQALALMNHPNIARILDAGTWASERDQQLPWTGQSALNPATVGDRSGQPYFVMEWVPGVPLTTYCDQHRLSIQQRLQLFLDVCAGVQHAHQKGIIHRDLKPSNVLVAQIDGQAIPKIIDFGLAKAMESTPRLTEQSLMTGIGQILGTLKYMSPEQASLDGMDIDTRSDIYSLGVILYELMTGSTPLDNSSLKGQAALQVLEFIREREAIKPSSKLVHELPTAVTQITEMRQTDRSRLQRILARDLDWIVMKALEKDRGRRYDSASDFAADIRRYLANEPVTARPPSVHYRLRKFVRKNRFGVLAAGLVFLTLLGGIATTSWSLLWALRAEEVSARRADEAETARKDEKLQRQLALTQAALAREQEAVANRNAAQAEQEKRIAETVREFLQNKLLRQASVWNQANTPVGENSSPKSARHDITVRELLDRAAEEYAPERIEARFPGQPIVQSEILDTIGATYLSVGEQQKALKLLEQALHLRQAALGAEDPTVTAMRIDLVFSYLKAQRQAAAIGEATIVVDQLLNKLEQWIATRDQLTTATDQQLARDQVGLSITNAMNAIEQRFALQNEGFETIKFSVVEAAMAALRIGQVTPKTRRLAELCEQEFGEQDRRTLYAKFINACCMHGLGQVEAASKIYEQIHELAETELPPDDLLLAGIRSLLAATKVSRADWQESIHLYQQIIPVIEKKLGAEHPAVSSMQHALAICLYRNSEYAKALPVFRAVYENCLRQMGAAHPLADLRHSNLALCLLQMNRSHEAIAILEEIHNRRKDDPNDLDALLTLRNNLATAYQGLGRYDQAISLLELSIEEAKKSKGDRYDTTLILKQNLVSVFRDAGRYEPAISLISDVIDTRTKSLGATHPSTVSARYLLVDVFTDAKQWNDSITALNSLIDLVKSDPKLARGGLPMLVAKLRDVYRQVNQPDQAFTRTETIYQELLETVGERDPLTLELMHQFGMELFENSDIAQAVQLGEKQVNLETDVHGPLHSRTMLSEIRLATKLFAFDRSELACRLLERVAQRLAQIDFRHELTVSVLENTILGYQRTGDAEAVQRWESHLIAHILQIEEPDLRHAESLAEIGLRRLHQAEWETSESVLRRCLDIRRKQQPDHWTIHNTESMLGAALLGLNRHSEAEPLLLAGYQGLMQKKSQLPTAAYRCITESLDRLIELYKALDQAESQNYYQNQRDGINRESVND